MKNIGIFIAVIILIILAGLTSSVINRGKPAGSLPNNQPITDPQDRITLESPKRGEEITSPLKVTGKARGPWYFEASFPVILTDWDGRIIAQGIAQAKGDWMTEEYVPFEATLNFERPFVDPNNIQDYERNGSLILKKDNPSGLPQNDAALEVQVKFK